MLFKIKVLVYKLLTNSFVGNFIGFFSENRIKLNTTSIDTSSQFIHPSVKAKIWWGFYEKAEIAFIKKYLRSDIDVIELGSSIGIVSSHIIKKLNSSSRLFCIEANSKIVPVIKNNLDINNSGVSYEIINAAISYDNQDFVEFQINEINTDSKIGQGGIKVKTTTLSDLVLNKEIYEFSLVCDIEGEEYHILDKDKDSFKNCKQLIIEFHESKNTSIKEGVNKLLELGFYQKGQKGNVYYFEK